MPYAEVAPVLDERVRGLCLKPYPLHPRGCPNFGRVPRCPPRVPLVWVRYDLSRPCYVVWSRFDLGAHAQKVLDVVSAGAMLPSGSGEAPSSPYSVQLFRDWIAAGCQD